MKIEGNTPFPEQGKDDNISNKQDNKITKSVFDFNRDGVIRENEASQYLSAYDDGSQAYQSLFRDFCNSVCDISYNMQNIDNVIDSFMPKFQNIVDKMDKNSPEYKARDTILNTKLKLNNMEDIANLMNQLIEQGASDISVTESFDKQATPRAMVSYIINNKQHKISVEMQEPVSNGNADDENNHLDDIKSLASTITEDNISEVMAKMTELGATDVEDVTDGVISFCYRVPNEHTMKYKLDYTRQNKIKIIPKQEQIFFDQFILNLDENSK